MFSIFVFYNPASLNTEHISWRLHSWAQWLKAASYHWLDSCHLSEIMALLLLVYLHPAHFGHRKDSLWATNIFRNERHSKSERLPNFIKHSPKRCNKYKIETIFCYSLLKPVLFSALSWKVRSSTWPCKRGPPKISQKKAFVSLYSWRQGRHCLSQLPEGWNALLNNRY